MTNTKDIKRKNKTIQEMVGYQMISTRISIYGHSFGKWPGQEMVWRIENTEGGLTQQQSINSLMNDGVSDYIKTNKSQRKSKGKTSVY